MVSMVSTGLLLWIAWLCYRGYQHHCRENGQYSTSAVMSWMKERLFFWRQGTGAGTEHEQSKRKKRTFRRQHQQQWQREQGVQKHEDYWTEESEDQTKNFPLRAMAGRSGGGGGGGRGGGWMSGGWVGGMDSSTRSIDSQTSMLYNVSLDDSNWDESVSGGGSGGGGAVAGTDGYSAQSQHGINLINREL
jgi:hypothetical protein